MADQDSQRIDAWLWRTRFFKTRALATALVSKGRVRINGERIKKPSRQIRPGDTLTFPQATDIRVIRVLAYAERRGPASEAQSLYEVIEEE